MNTLQGVVLFFLGVIIGIGIRELAHWLGSDKEPRDDENW